jgi:hypothetical protein
VSSFDGKLREYLTHLDLPRLRTVDEHELRKHFLSRVRELGDRAEVQYSSWSPHLARVARYIERLPASELPTDPAGALDWTRRWVDAWLAVGDIPSIDLLEFARLVDPFERSDRLEMYALENRLVRREAAELRVTRIGGVFVRLWGREGVRWLLTVEIAQSRGNTDTYRASRDLLERAIRGEVRPWFDDNHVPWFGFHRETLSRLVEMDVLRELYTGPSEDPELAGYPINPAMKDVVQRALEQGPWQAMVTAMLEDEHAVVVHPVGRAVDAAIETTRLIAHEVRNALIPVRHQIDAVAKQFGGPRNDSTPRGAVWFAYSTSSTRWLRRASSWRKCHA